MPLYSTACPLPVNRKIFRRKASSAPFSPTDIGGISVWLKADAGVTISGGLVTGWADQSGNGANCSSPNVVLFYSSPYPYIYFGGPDTESEITLHPDVFNDSSALSFFAVWRITNGDNNGVIGTPTYSNFEITTGYNEATDSNDSAVRMRNDNYDASINIGGWWNDQEFSLSTLAIDSSDKSGTMRLNGSASGVNFTPINSEALQAGQTYKIGVYGGGYFAEISLAELIVYSEKLNSSQISQVETYLNSKYAIY